LQKKNPEDSAAVAGDRKYDVYMGIDVFGRNTFGGGQWTVCVTIYFYSPLLLIRNTCIIN
jgi:mannosyl-glycoprotein endo-beta-N-acetylglucosaminidase